MLTVNETMYMPYSTEQMYKLVNDVISYPKFLPGCTESKIFEYSSTKMIASIKISKAGINTTLMTQNTLKYNQSILIHLIHGPCKTLQGEWIFTPISKEICFVTFCLKIEPLSKLSHIFLNCIFSEIISSLMRAFSIRAKKLYKNEQYTYNSGSSICSSRTTVYKKNSS